MLKLLIVWISLVIAGALNSCVEQVSAARAVTWNFVFDGNEAKLAYGRPNSDEVGLMLTCKPNSGAVTLAGDVSPDRPVFTLSSGKAVSRLAGAVEPDPMTGGSWMEVSAPVDTPALAGFARSGKLELARGERSLRMTASSADRPLVRRFFETCA